MVQSYQKARQLAQSGNLAALLALINHSLKPRGIRATAQLRDQRLCILLDSPGALDPQEMRTYIGRGIARLKFPGVHTLHLYGKLMATDIPAWGETIPLSPVASKLPAPVPESPTETPERGLTPQQLLSTHSSLESVLLGSLWLQIALNALFVLYCLAWVFSNSLFLFLGLLDNTGTFFPALWMVIGLIQQLTDALDTAVAFSHGLNGLITLFWLYYLHLKLRVIFKNYPIRPWMSVLLSIIPFYYFWGIWKIFSVLARFLALGDQGLARRGRSLKRWVAYTLLSLLITNSVFGFVRFQIFNSGADSISPVLYLLRNSTALIFSLLWLQTIRVTNQAISLAEGKVSELQQSASQKSLPTKLKSSKETKLSFQFKFVLYGWFLDVIGTYATHFLLYTTLTAFLTLIGLDQSQIFQLYASHPFILFNIISGACFTLLGSCFAATLAQRSYLGYGLVGHLL